MSSRPGLDLEDYLGWAYNLVIEGSDENNVSLGIAEALGTATRLRPVLTKEEFAPIVEMFEPFREQVEHYLLDFDEDNQSWRDYAGAVFGFLPEELDANVFAYIASVKNKPTPVTEIKETQMEYITKQMIKSIRPFVVLPKVAKNLCDAIALVAAHSHYESPQQDNFVKSRVSGLLRDVSSAIVPSNLDYFTGNGPMARYLREHLAVEMLLENVDGSFPITLGEIRKEIDQKFNYNPNGRLDSVEWKNIIISIIELQTRFFALDDTTYDSLWKIAPPNQPITESGLYLYDNEQKVINLVFKVNDISVTMTILADQDPMVNVYHEWEETNINIYGVCFFPGMFKAMTEEIEKLTVVK